ncbi:TetR/AcrR family transcriptional regulator [Actinoallomurus spadix]|uniref:TetR/AcrR family transcriptional regulator n=1 Tax=Actinoallomurus spadix TaxID=79912 RepID=A0ABN0XMN0_9ACTN|nr:TetR/AcrR family transcriptional regulator [Actinoallomurus spadix]MCO5985215.1 TetR/AcrR family transcriptional regulator [Actinoallomurus spadix]
MSIGRPRDAARDRAILAATLELLAEAGYPALRIDEVARRAGVAKTTIYRRWPSKGEMVLDAIATHLGDRSIEETGDPLRDLRRLLEVTYEGLAETVAGRALPALAAEIMADPGLAGEYRRRFVHPLRDRARALIDRAVAEGSLRPEVDPDLLMDVVVGPSLYRPIVMGVPAPAASASAVFDLVIHGAGLP